MPKRLPIEKELLAAICRRHGIKKLSVFGSELKGTAGPESDIDLLVEFLPEARPSLFDMVQIEIDLSQGMRGRKVDVRTARDLSPYFRDEVVSEAQVAYEAR